MMIKDFKSFSDTKFSYSEEFKKALNEIKSPISNALLKAEGEIYNITNNYIDIVKDDNDKISFISERRVKSIKNQLKDKKFFRVKNHGGTLTYSKENDKIFDILGFVRKGENMYRPNVGEIGEFVSQGIGPISGRSYTFIKFDNGDCVINSNNIEESDMSNFFYTKNRQTIRVGRGVKSLLTQMGHTFNDSEIEGFVNSYKAYIDKLNDIFRLFEVVKDEDIAYWYNRRNYEQNKGQLSSSCMSDVPNSFLHIYVKNPKNCSLLILKSENNENKIRGRALVWNLTDPNITYMDRVYTHNDSDMELFYEYAKKMGWYKKRYNDNESNGSCYDPNGNPINYNELYVILENYDFDHYPYLDTLKYLDMSNGKLSTNEYNSDRTLETTNGTYSELEDEEWDED